MTEDNCRIGDPKVMRKTKGAPNNVENYNLIQKHEGDSASPELEPYYYTKTFKCKNAILDFAFW